MALIYLIGYRATGKSTVGRLLSSRLCCPFYDLDICLCDYLGKSVAEIVAQEGWEGFRRQETETLQRVSRATWGTAVLATGGGVILSPGNRQFLRAHGLVFWLDAPEQIIASRLGADPHHAQRPSLTGQGLLPEIAATLRERLPLYAACAHHRINANQREDAVCEAILAALDTDSVGEKP